MATRPMSRVGRARERSETQGFMKVLVDAESKLVLGAALLGIEADEVVQSILHMMAASYPTRRSPDDAHSSDGERSYCPAYSAICVPFE